MTLPILHSTETGEIKMAEQEQLVEFPPLKEHDFQSNTPVIGPLIQIIRRGIYALTAKWGVLAIIHQQNRINRLVAQHLQDHDVWLVDQDHDLAHLTRTIAEMEIRQRYLLQCLASLVDQAPNARTPETPEK
jgi:hypothetical protein